MTESGLSGKTALVTGGSRGIGRAACLALAGAGANVAVNYAVDATAAAETCEAIGALGVRCKSYKADVSQADQVQAMVAGIEADLGPVDLMVANAGTSVTEDPAELSFDVWRRMMAVNADGAYLSITAVAPGMVARGYGRIVCISSVAALRPRPRMIAYSAAKAAVIALVRSTAAAYAPAVRINCIAPGLIDTELANTLTPEEQRSTIAATPMGRLGRPEEIADAALYLLSDASSYLTGDTLAVSGGRVTLP